MRSETSLNIHRRKIPKDARQHAGKEMQNSNENIEKILCTKWYNQCHDKQYNFDDQFSNFEDISSVEAYGEDELESDNSVMIWWQGTWMIIKWRWIVNKKYYWLILGMDILIRTLSTVR